MPQLQINQGPQDALLYDNTRSYFTNVGYVRTSNFQTEYKYQPASTGKATFGSKTEFVIAKAADLLGPVDLVVDLKAAAASGIPDTLAAQKRVFTQWVDELGFAMLERVTFTIGSVDIETITGEQLQIKNELMTSDEMRLGYDTVLKTGRRAFKTGFGAQIPNIVAVGTITASADALTTVNEISFDAHTLESPLEPGDKLYKDVSSVSTLIGVVASATVSNVTLVANCATAVSDNDVIDVKRDPPVPTDPSELPGDNQSRAAGKAINKDYTRLISYQERGAGTGGSKLTCNARQLIIPLGFFFTKHVSQYFPLAAIAGCNDVRITVKFRSFKELVQVYKPGSSLTIDADENTLFGNGGAIHDCRLMCHYVHVTGPEAQTLMNKEHVRLLKLWQHQPKNLALTYVSGQTTVFNNEIDMDLNFLHPISTLIITIRREKDMTNEDSGTVDSAQKGYFFYHGDGTNPNYDRCMKQDLVTPIEGGAGTGTSEHTIKVKSIQLSLNGSQRHPDLDKGIETNYLQHRLLPALHSNSNEYQKQSIGSMSGADLEGTPEYQRYQLQGAKNIFVYPFSLNPEGSNPSGAVNFSKVSHAKLKMHLETVAPGAGNPLVDGANGAGNFRVDVYALYYNWLQIKDGRALLSFA